ncbi:hypothetical protein [Bradyrhizobium sp.]|uniref:hypothetical protein n=1 Tax=Bradyrhizobium sp. TaxID=376 RepID=UPI00261220F2|nr:hypothetical protein [Bradyrhizobium sp.]
MSTLKETTIAVPVVAALLFVSHIIFGPDESCRLPAITSWLGAVQVPDERFLATDSFTGRASDVVNAPSEDVPAADLTPQARIRTVFAQFVPRVRRSATQRDAG